MLSTASDLSLLETIEQRLEADVSVSLLAELERELLRLRSDFTGQQWRTFCQEFPKRRVFEVLRRNSPMLRVLSDMRLAFPSDILDVVMAGAFQARPSLAHSPAHTIGAWEYSLPASRSIRSRKAYFAREIAEVIRTAVKPRILILGAGHVREADDAIHAAPLQNAEFVALEPAEDLRQWLRRAYARCQMEVEAGNWNDLGRLAQRLGRFDLIYSTSWLDATDDSEAARWLASSVELLRCGGRIITANFAPGSRDAGWMEACWHWHPQYRSEEDLARLVMDLKQPGARAMIRGHAVFRDESGASAYLEIHSL